MKKLLAILILVIILSGCANKENSKERLPIPETPKEKIEYALNKNPFADTIEISGDFTKEPYTISVDYKGKETTSEESAVKYFKQAIVYALYEIKGSGYKVDSLEVSLLFPTTDQYGNTNEEHIIESLFFAETIDKLNSDKTKFDPDNLPNIADVWVAHPSIK